jgi:DNA-directed RNA polymerase specialized sigma24 family protein
MYELPYTDLVLEALMAEVARIAAIPDPEEQAREVARLLDDLNVTKNAAVELRAEVVRRLREHRSHGEIASLLGISRGGAQQIAEGRHKGPRRQKGARREAEDHSTE